MQAVTESEKLRDHIENLYAAVQVPGLTRRVLKVSQADGKIVVGYEVAPLLANRAGFIQGGICAVMLESAMSMAGAVKSGGLMSTPMFDIKMSLLRPAAVGPLTVHAEVVQMGRTLAFMEARLADAAGKILARASGTATPKPVG